MTTKRLFRTMLMAISCVSLFAFVACSDDDDDKVNETLKIKPEKIEIVVEETGKAVISDGTAPYTVAISDKDIAKAEMDADTVVITGLKEGSAIITITDKNKFSGKVTVTVKEAPEVLSFDKDEVTIEVDKDAVVTVEGGTAPYTATVGDETVATAEVSEDKITIKGVKVGTTTVTVSDEEENSGTISVTIK